MPGEQELSDFQRTFRLDELTIGTCGAWVVSVRPAQITMGSLVISSATGRLGFRELDDAERTSLGQCFSVVERLAVEVLGADRVNFLCLMMKDPVVHFHALPRYFRDMTRFGVQWQDSAWPGPPTLEPVETDDRTRARMVTDLRDAFRGII